ncbi:MAG: iron-sulfur cluster repair di-iron protein [Opitutus sp.]|nr:iron-sulfur cluster repair di-iron protein [Opitutus sp.]
MIHSSFSPDATVGNIVAAQPDLARLFERVGIDYCCGGKRTLAQACAGKGLDPAAFAVLLAAAAKLPAAGPTVDARAMSLTALADHIEQTHHCYLKEELPALAEKADRVAGKHGGRDPRLLVVAETIRALAGEMFHHMAKEEQILFPLVRELERAGTVASHCGSIANPIRQMELEHDGAGAAVARLRELTDGFVPDAAACNTHRAMLAGFARLESDLHAHVHKENNVLFPRALALEAHAAA